MAYFKAKPLNNKAYLDFCVHFNRPSFNKKAYPIFSFEPSKFTLFFSMKTNVVRFFPIGFYNEAY